MALTAAFLTELAKKKFRANLVLSIDGTFFSQYQVDSGIVIDSDKLGIVDNVKINGVTLDIRKANTPIATIGFRLLDKNEVVSIFMGNSVDVLQNSEVKLFFGFRTGSFDFSDYASLGVTRINSIQKIDNAYSFGSKESTDLIQTNLLNIFSTLDGAINDVVTSLTLKDAADFPSSGRIKLGDEFILYSSKSTNTLTGLTRGDLTSTAEAHDDGDKVSLVTKKEAKSMDIILDILLIDLGIDSALVDSTSFTNLRDDDFSGEDDFILYIYDIDNALKFLETRILDATNTRLFSINGVITIGLLDQVPKFETTPEIDEDSIERIPSWRITSDRIVNKIIVKFAFNEGNQKFGTTLIFKDTDSIATFEERTALTLELFGVFSTSIANNRANRLLTRLSTPKASIKVRTHFDQFDINIASNVRLTHRHLPQSGGGLGFSDTLEVMSKTVSGLEFGANITFGLEFSSYTGIRFGAISPSPKLDLAITDQKTFTVPDGSCYRVGYRLLLFDNVNNLYFADPVNIVADVTGDVITMEDNWVTTLGSNVSLYFADYDDSNGDQRARFVYIAPDIGLFVIDGSKAYQIIF